ncbi:hypothetical protein EON65_21645 [archaeon]|nr:MAG: hypothetical protein EON65_21645 [archaeon]
MLISSLSFLCVTTTLLLFVGAAVRHNYVVMDQALTHISSRPDLLYQHKAPPDTIHEVIFEVRHSNLDQLRTIVDEISDPDHARYGQHLSKQELDDLLLNHASREALVTHLHGIAGVLVDQSISTAEYITAQAPIAVWESFFQTSFYTYRYSRSRESSQYAELEPVYLHRAQRYSLPSHLAEYVSAVYNTVQFPPPLLNLAEPIIEKHDDPSSFSRAKSHLRSQKIAASNYVAPGYVNPFVLWQFHNMSINRGNSRAFMSVYATSEEAVSPNDLHSFQRNLNIQRYALANSYTSPYIADDACKKYNCNEGNLNTQYMMAMSQATPTNYTYWSGPDYWLSFVLHVASLSKVPNVIAIPYATNEDELSSAYFHSFNVQALKLAARGVTIVASSGNNGAIAPGATSAACRYITVFPASSPYVTAVGGVQGFERNLGNRGCSTRNRESVFTSGGGFSKKFRAQAWQNSSINAYFQRLSTQPATGFNRAGRGYPDISSLGRSYQIVSDNANLIVSGTSAAVPTIAGLIGLVNSQRLAVNKSPLGWLNPLLYKYAQSFVVDVPTGRDNQCNLSGFCCAQGFVTATGWDPMTGLGTLDFGRFLARAMSLESRPNIPSLAPSVKPTANPVPAVLPPGVTAKPTHLPSPMPTSSQSGWVYTITYDDTMCSGLPILMVAHEVNKCVPQYRIVNGGLSSLRYQKIVTTTTSAVTEYYQDLACSIPLSPADLRAANLSVNTRMQYGCSMVEDSYYYGAEGYASSFTALSTATDITTVFPRSNSTSGALQYITQKQYSFVQCNNIDLHAVAIYPLNYCVNLESFPNSRSYRIVYPSLEQYQDTRCDQQPQYFRSTLSIPEGCSGAFSYPDGTSTLSMLWTI